jgi:hypothetical protein
VYTVVRSLKSFNDDFGWLICPVPELPPTWILTVNGKRNKTHDVPLADEVLDLLRDDASPGRRLRVALPEAVFQSRLIIEWR